LKLTKVQGKHKREEDEADERLLITEVKGKKSKSDADVIKQEEEEAAAALIPPASKTETVGQQQSVDDGSSPTSTAEFDEETEKAAEGTQSSEAGLEKADEESTSKGTPSIEMAPSHASPNVSANRENSRLRIYFSSPVTEPRAISDHPPVMASENRSDSVSSVSLSREGLHQHPEGGYEESGLAEAESIAADAVATAPPDVDGEALSLVEHPLDVQEVATAGEAATATESEGEAVYELESAHSVTHPARSNEPSGDGDDVRPAESDSMSTREASQYPPEPYPPVELSEAEIGSRYATPGLRPEPAPDRISISYARNTRRIVVDVDVVERVRIHRAEGKVEVTVNLIPPDPLEGGKFDDFRVCKGILVR
jgi:hypothetical protein